MNLDLLSTVTYVCILGILVIVHEWGHFIVARMCKIRVDEFSIGFGPRALRIGKLGDTEYNVRWVPLGGYVKIAGMEADEEPLLNARDKAKGILEQRKTDELISKTPLLAENLPNVDETEAQRAEDVVDGFYSKPLWQRSLVIFAGPAMSFIFGYALICVMGCFIGLPEPNNVVDQVTPHSVAQAIGLRHDDRIVMIDNTVIHDGEQMVSIIYGSNNKTLKLTLQRASQTLIIYGTPKVQAGSGTDSPVFGFSPGTTIKRESLQKSIHDGNTITGNLLNMLKQLVARHNFSELRQHALGPIGVAGATYEAVKEGVPQVYFLAAQLSISLAIFNLLPIPILDGGHLLLFAVEGTRRGRRLTVQQQQNFLLTGLAIIGLLFVAIMFNDISRHFTH